VLLAAMAIGSPPLLARYGWMMWVFKEREER
jgi:hypothetical protein